MSETPTANSTIAHYRIVSKIGAGGMGEVYLAEDTRLNRRVAIKVLPADVVNNRERLHRFTQEAQAASALNHPNIITIYEIGAADGTRFIATEFIEGETLRLKLQTTRLEIGETLSIATQIAAALDAAHRHGIVHRDIKPENVMLRADGLVKVLDFGLAKLTPTKPETIDTEAPTQVQVNTQAGMILGTVAYMSPEQARGLKVDARTDIFSLGVVLYELLTGSLPFAGATASDMIAAILKAEPAPLAEDTPAELQRIVRKALRKDADERYQTAKDLLLDLKNLKHDLDFASELERSGIPTRADQSEPTQDHGVHTTSGAEYSTSGIRQHKLSIAVALALLLLAALGFGYWSYNHRSATAPQINSIAVLPFVNESGNADVEYLSDGMTESLINSLSQLPNLAVKARSSVFRYKGKAVEPQQVASDLSVQAVLGGRVIQRGDDLTLYLSLVDARTSDQIWGEQYNRKLSDLVALQGEVARDVSNKLRVKLSGADEQRLAKTYTENSDAYQLYLKGRFYWNKRTEEGIRKGIEFFQQAIDKDPNFAPAYVGVADSYILLGIPEAMTGVIPTREALPKARAAAERALEIDDSLAEAHTSLGQVKIINRDLAGAGEEYRRSIALNPNYATAHHWYALYLTNLGRFDEALSEIRRAQALDPLSLPINTNVGTVFFFARRYDEAIEQCKRTLDMDATFALAHNRLGLSYEQKGLYKEAVAEFRQAIAHSNQHPTAMAALAHAYAVSGDKGEAQKVLGELTQLSARRYVAAYDVAVVYAGLGEKEEALRWLEKAVEQQDYVSRLKIDPRLDPLRSDPRFSELVRKVGLPQ